jgi:FkbM family methyltransferase
MKKLIQLLLQRILGFENYLYFLSIFKVYTSKYNKMDEEFHFFLSLLNENSVVLDIGANVGVTTILLANKLKSGFVYSFEPVSVNYHAMERAVSMFKVKNVKLFNTALGNKIEDAKMRMPICKSVKMPGYSHVIEQDNIDLGKSLIFDVEIKVLDCIKEIADSKIDAMKIDVEGYERFVIEGSMNLIRKNRPIIYCELTNAENKLELIKTFKYLNYRIFVFENNKLIPYESETRFLFNSFFLPI